MTITTSYDQINSFRPDCATGRFPNADLQPCSPWGAINGLYLDADMNLIEIIDNEKRCSQHQSPFIHEIPDRVTELLNKADAAQRRAQKQPPSWTTNGTSPRRGGLPIAPRRSHSIRPPGKPPTCCLTQ